MRILLTGAAGSIGKELSKYLRTFSYQLIPVDMVRCKNILSADLREEAKVYHLLKEYTPDLILHLAAQKNLLFCEQNKEVAHSINYGITEILTRACLELKTRMIFFSSDYVFGKYDSFWQENDLPCPTTQYGIDKVACEKLIQERLSDYAIIRTAQLYGFPGDFINLVCETLASKQNFFAFTNLINCLTWIGDLFPMVHQIINQNSQGIFHCVGSEAMSRHQFACEIAKALALDPSYIQAIDLDFSKDIRPPSVRLDGTFTYQSLQVYPGRVRDNLFRCSNHTRSCL
ncbi:MAG: sugar nucleotide-binding protein [Spirochaetota bacterium]